MRTDESQGFADFVSAEQAALPRLAVLLTGGRADAEDLVHTALMKTYGHWPRISRSGPPSPDAADLGQ
jgi:DNA-directed RNA polymerase specialized sigma24 family protein